MNLNKPTKQQIAEAILELYKASRKFNIIAGNKSLDKKRLHNQINLVKSEFNETLNAVIDSDPIEIVDGCCDLLVTLCEAEMIEAGETFLLDNAPIYLNEEDLTVEDLITNKIKLELEENNVIDALGYVEDLCYAINAPMIYNMQQVAASNFSKFMKKEDLDNTEHTAEDLCKMISDKGRYPEVYYEIVNVDDEDWIVLKSDYDAEEDKHFECGKVVKNPLTFFEPEIKVYDI